MTTCEQDGTLQADRCLREEQCDDCYFKDHPEELMTMTEEQYLESKLEIEKFEKKAKEDFPLQKDDYVEYLTREATEHVEERWGRGFVEVVLFNREKGEVYINVQDKNNLRRRSFNSSFYAKDIGNKVKGIDNPLPPEKIEDIEKELGTLEDDKSLIRDVYEERKSKLLKRLSELRSLCIHKWEQGELVGEKERGGDIYSYDCKNCGLTDEL